jgi:hypothetical protein
MNSNRLEFKAPRGHEYSVSTLEAFDFLLDPTSSLNDVNEEDLSRWLQAFGPEAFCECRAMLEDQSPMNAEEPRVQLPDRRLTLDEIQDTQPRFAWPASIAGQSSFPRALFRLRRVEHIGTSWDAAFPKWDNTGLIAAVVFTDDENVVRFFQPPTGWTFTGEALSGPESRPKGKDGRFPSRNATEISLLCGKTLQPSDEIRVAIHAFGPKRQYIGCVVLTPE